MEASHQMDAHARDTAIEVAAHWGSAILKAERPAAITARDGQLLRLVPANQRLQALAPHLAAVLAARPLVQAEAARLTMQPGTAKACRNRAALAWMRGWAYLQTGNAEQALLDGRSAVAHAPKDQHGQCTWAAAHALCAAALEAAQDWTQAALHMQQAAELDPKAYKEAAEQLAQRLPEPQAAALVAGGAAALKERLEWEREEALPEVLRRRPKYHYYNAWMSQRISRHFPELPAPVVAKLLALDAGDLDLMLQHPLALQGQVHELLGVLEAGGPAALAAHQPLPLSWEEVQALAGPGTIGLPLGYEAPPQPLLPVLPVVQPLLKAGAGQLPLPEGQGRDAGAVVDVLGAQAQAAVPAAHCVHDDVRMGEDAVAHAMVTDGMKQGLGLMRGGEVAVHDVPSGAVERVIVAGAARDAYAMSGVVASGAGTMTGVTRKTHILKHAEAARA